MCRLAAIALIVSARALADEGEVHIGGAGEFDVAWLRHPTASETWSFDEHTAFGLLPRVVLALRYSVTNEVALGLGIDVGAAANLVTNNVVVGGVAGQLITAAYVEAGAPVSLGWRFDSGYDLSALAAVDIGPTFALWTGNALADPQRRDAAGRPAALPFDVADASQPGLRAGLRLLLEARLFDAVSVSAGPYLGAAWTGSPSLRLGVVVEGAWISGAGPP